MSILLWLLRGFIFVILLGLAIKNSSEVELRFFFDAAWQAPLSVVILFALVFGVALGLLALLPQVIRQRREIGRLKRLDVKLTDAEAEAKATPKLAPPVDG